jgi:hypothetical protein
MAPCELFFELPGNLAPFFWKVPQAFLKFKNLLARLGTKESVKERGIAQFFFKNILTNSKNSKPF